MPASVRLTNHLTYDCVIRDISEGGALLEFPSRNEISGRLRLSFDGDSQEIICDVRHTRGNRVGVQFARAIALAARPIAMPVSAEAPLPAAGPVQSGNRAAAQLVASRRQAAKVPPSPVPVAKTELSPPTVRIPETIPESIEAPPPRDISSLLDAVAALAAERAVPRPLPAGAYWLPLVVDPPAVTVPRDMSSLIKSVTALADARAVPRPLPARAYAPRAA